MVVGLDKFREYFTDHPSSYVIIGGTACDVIIEARGLIPRATDDIDMILIIEALNSEFVKRFWRFINDGKYKTRQKSTEERKCYRFRGPETVDFPIQIELFCRTPDLMDLDAGAHLTPIPTEDDIPSLSAILMNDEYYQYTIEHSFLKDGILLANLEALICLKAVAFLENKKRRDAGARVSRQDVFKHKYDVFRLALFLTPEDIFDLPASIKADMQTFIEAVKNDLPDPDIFRRMGAGNVDANMLLGQLKKNFNLK